MMQPVADLGSLRKAESPEWGQRCCPVVGKLMTSVNRPVPVKDFHTTTLRCATLRSYLRLSGIIHAFYGRACTGVSGCGVRTKKV